MQTQTEKLSLINGRIHTPSSVASNITFEHGRIVSIDDDPANITSSGKVIDLHGRTVLPAFCDTGLDFLGWAENQERLSLASVTSAKAFASALGAYVQANPKPLRGWYIAQGLSGNIHISRDDLDAVIPSVPCAVIDADYTHAVLNTPAMSEFNMPQDNTELEGFFQNLPPLSREDIIYLVKAYAPRINAIGISEVWGDFYGDAGFLWDIFASDAYEFLSFRLRMNFGFPDVIALNEFLAYGLRTGDGLPFCRLGGILVSEMLPHEEQKNMIVSSHLSGCQVIGGSGQYCVNVLENTAKRFRKNTRHLIMSGSFSTKLLDKMSFQGFGGITLSGNDDNELHSAFQNGIVVSAASGSNLVPPLKNLGLMVNNGLSVAEALCVYTWSASWNGSTEHRRGDIALGNDADVVVLEQDPFLVKPEEISAIDVTMTFSAGCRVYDSGTI